MPHPLVIEPMIRFVYAVLMWLLVPLLLLKLLWRSRSEPNYLQAVPERFGVYAMPAQAGAVWVHAVSLGETRAALALVRALRAAQPQIRFVFTHGTATGRHEGLAMLQVGDAQVWQPWDTPQAVQRFFTHFKPRLGLLIDTEVWPNLLWQAKDLGIPVVLANARLSNKSWRKALHWGWLSRPAFSSLQAVWAQTEEDANRLRSLGASVTAVTGNLKFDAQPDPGLLQIGQNWRAQAAKPIVVLAISRAGEEAALLDLLLINPALMQAVQWWIVPRHPQRFDEVAALVLARGLALVRRSDWSDTPVCQEVVNPQAVVLGDTLGEMSFYFGAASVALLGGSFAPVGGQNLIEACACGCPVVMGPHTYNFAQAANSASLEGAAWRVENLAQGMQKAHDLALDRKGQARMAGAARAFAQRHQGAVAECVDLMRDWLV